VVCSLNSPSQKTYYRNIKTEFYPVSCSLKSEIWQPILPKRNAELGRSRCPSNPGATFLPDLRRDAQVPGQRHRSFAPARPWLPCGSCPGRARKSPPSIQPLVSRTPCISVPLAPPAHLDYVAFH
jgi:hypothetical protein